MLCCKAYFATLVGDQICRTGAHCSHTGKGRLLLHVSEAFASYGRQDSEEGNDKITDILGLLYGAVCVCVCHPCSTPWSTVVK